jgi:hypothetical protein
MEQLGELCQYGAFDPASPVLRSGGVEATAVDPPPNRIGADTQ